MIHLVSIPKLLSASLASYHFLPILLRLITLTISQKQPPLTMINAPLQYGSVMFVKVGQISKYFLLVFAAICSS